VPDRAAPREDQYLLSWGSKWLHEDRNRLTALLTHPALFQPLLEPRCRVQHLEVSGGMSPWRS